MNDILSEEEIRELTNKVHRSAQSRVLTRLGIEHRARPDGSLVVHRSERDRALGIRHNRRPVSNEINWA
jgi:hypothetical protein